MHICVCLFICLSSIVCYRYISGMNKNNTNNNNWETLTSWLGCLRCGCIHSVSQSQHKPQSEAHSIRGVFRGGIAIFPSTPISVMLHKWDNLELKGFSAPHAPSSSQRIGEGTGREGYERRKEGRRERGDLPPPTNGGGIDAPVIDWAWCWLFVLFLQLLTGVVSTHL